MTPIRTIYWKPIHKNYPLWRCTLPPNGVNMLLPPHTGTYCIYVGLIHMTNMRHWFLFSFYNQSFRRSKQNTLFWDKNLQWRWWRCWWRRCCIFTVMTEYLFFSFMCFEGICVCVCVCVDTLGYCVCVCVCVCWFALYGHTYDVSWGTSNYTCLWVVCNCLYGQGSLWCVSIERSWLHLPLLCWLLSVVSSSLQTQPDRKETRRLTEWSIISSPNTCLRQTFITTSKQCVCVCVCLLFHMWLTHSDECRRSR